MATVIDFRVRPGTKKVLEAMSPDGKVPKGPTVGVIKVLKQRRWTTSWKSLDAHGSTRLSSPSPAFS